jgi:predicted HicB family RNase H-like nuclease
MASTEENRAKRGKLPDGWVATCIRMPDELHAAAVARATAEERTLAQLIRYVSRLYVDGKL